MKSIEELKISRICRICLKSKVPLYSIFNQIFAGEVDTTISHIISECTRFKVERDDYMPQQICSVCMDSALKAFCFKRQTEQAYSSISETSGKPLFNLLIDQENFYSHSCEMCGETFYNQKSLTKHRHNDHTEDSKKCIECETEFMNFQDLRNHLVDAHPHLGIAKGAECKTCNRFFSHQIFLDQHLLNAHQEPVDRDSLNKTMPYMDSILCDVKICVDQNPSSVADLSEPVLNSTSEEYTANTDSSSLDDAESIELQYINKEPLVKNNVALKSVLKTLDDPEIIEKSNENGNELMKDISTDVCQETDVCSYDFKNEPIQSFSPYKESNISFDIDPHNKPYYDDILLHNILLEDNDINEESSANANTCKQCHRVFSRHCHLVRHMLSHSGEKTQVCPYCNKKFARKDHLNKHIINIHAEKKFKCEYCRYAFVTSELLKRHTNLKHSENMSTKIHCCSYCDKKFSSKSYLQKHLLIHTDLIFACKFCEATYKERSRCSEHEKIHTTASRKYLCSICGESFKRNDYLQVHMRRHTGERPYKCQYCPKTFPRSSDVTVHERYHTGDKPNKCNICNKSFYRAYNLNLHMRTHTGEKPYKCDQCPQAFAQSNDLKSHLRRHTGERFHCEHCDAAFLQQYALRNHLSNAHNVNLKSPTGRVRKLQLKRLKKSKRFEPSLTEETIMKRLRTLRPRNCTASENQVKSKPRKAIRSELQKKKKMQMRLVGFSFYLKKKKSFIKPLLQLFTTLIIFLVY